MIDKTKLNIPLLRQIQAFIKEEPRRFDMSDWLSRWRKEETEEDHRLPPCGTTGCIGGAAVLLSGVKCLTHEIPVYAGRLLGLTSKDDLVNENNWDENEDLRRLFLADTWPEPFNSQHHAARVTQPPMAGIVRRAEIACARIDHLIEHGE
jgi:hypothetical protein